MHETVIRHGDGAKHGAGRGNWAWGGHEEENGGHGDGYRARHGTMHRARHDAGHGIGMVMSMKMGIGLSRTLSTGLGRAWE